MELLKQLELVEVTYENDSKKAVMTFLDREHGEIRNVNFNRQSYDNTKNTFVDDPDKAKKVDEWCEKYFNLPFDQLTKALGTKHDVYAYDTFNSLFECDIVEKFDKSRVGEILNTTIKEIVVDNYSIRIRFTDDGKTYESKMSYGKYLEQTKEWFVDPLKKQQIYKKFEEKFGLPIERANELVGHQVIVEVKTAFNKFIYAEIKPFPKKLKK